MTVDRGDAYDVTHAFLGALASPKFLDVLTDVMAAKGAGLSVLLPPSGPTVKPHEVASKQAFPLAEIIVYSGQYTQDTTVKEARWRLGIRWTQLGDTEGDTVRDVQLLTAATVELLWNDAQTPGGEGLLSDYGVNAGPVSVIEEDFGALLPAISKPFLKSSVVIVEVTTWRE